MRNRESSAQAKAKSKVDVMRGNAVIVDGIVVFPSFRDVMQKDNDWKAKIITVVSGVIRDGLVLLSLALILWTPIIHAINARDEALTAERAQSEIMEWPRAKVDRESRQAKDYNRRIAESGQTRLGEIVDPFAPAGAQSKKTLSERDSAYQSLLKGPKGMMGIIRVPKISLNLPIYHGTSKKALLKGAGHLYGTSLPGGGKSTNVVLCGHRGLPDALLFTRLDELRKGDMIYMNSLDRIMGYKVTAIHVIEPDDVHLYKVVPGRDLVTLMTCTPYGVNTERLVITAQRCDVPGFHGNSDAVVASMIVFAVVTLLGVGCVLAVRRSTMIPPPMHDAGSSVRRGILWWRCDAHEGGVP